MNCQKCEKCLYRIVENKEIVGCSQGIDWHDIISFGIVCFCNYYVYDAYWNNKQYNFSF